MTIAEQFLEHADVDPLGEPGGRPLVAVAADRGDRARQGLVQAIPGEQHQGVQGLPLGGGRHLALGGTVGAQALHFLCPEPVRSWSGYG
jgi:hypothetical protein